jgi:hypothetical protein
MKARPSKPRFAGGFKTFTVSISINREKRVESRFCVFSQGSRNKVFEYLWLKLLWDELSRLEIQLVMLSELNSNLKFSILKSINSHGKVHTRNRLLKLFPEGTYSRERYQGFKRLDVEIYEFQRNLPKTPKFSGWIRSASAIGSKRPLGGSSYLDTLTSTEYKDEIIIDWYHLLTVVDNTEISQWVFQNQPDED